MTKPILIVSSPYYTDISAALVAGAKAAITEAGFTYELVEVPGALEIPGAVAIGIGSGHFSGYVALGCVLRGETTHYDTVANESARGLMDLTVTRRAAIGNGILTCETEEQALLRADVAQGNKGGEAARAAITLIAIAQKLGVAA